MNRYSSFIGHAICSTHKADAGSRLNEEVRAASSEAAERKKTLSVFQKFCPTVSKQNVYFQLRAKGTEPELFIKM